MNNIKPLRSVLFHTIFWGWNLIFLTVFYLGILPHTGVWLIRSTLEGTTPVDFCLTFLSLIAVPTVCTIYALKHLKKHPQRLMHWFYGVEAPLVVWCLVRLFVIRELTLASILILGTLITCIIAFGIEVFQGYHANDRVFARLQAIAHTLILFMGVYVGIVFSFYVIPVGAYVIKGAYHLVIEFFSFNWIEMLQYELSYGGSYLFYGGLFFLLFGFSSTLFVAMPFVFTHLYVNSGQKILRAFARQHGKQRAMTVCFAVIGTWLLLFGVFTRQPQVEAFNLLAQTPQNRTELLTSANKIRRGLINANLYPYRYLSTRKDSNHIYALYENLGLPSSAARFVQNRYNQFLSPFLYQGSATDVAKSAQLYAEFFDTPIQKAERKSVRHAIQSTAIVDQAKAGVLNIDQKKVWLAKQEVNVQPHGDWADVELHEVYENQTNDVEEILYYFSLPESAAITGLWLGETEDLTQRFTYQVSPRGAAQEVYNSQVRRTRPVDPALLEQVGPLQYRLRAFPIPPKPPVTRGVNTDTPQMHLWLTYKVMQQDRGWALPKLAERRNIFWSWRTKRIRNGKVKRFFSDTWLEDFAEKRSKKRQNHYIELQNGYRVAIEPSSDRALRSKLKGDDALPPNRKYALILDTSYSMRDRQEEIKEAITWWRDRSIDLNNHADLYITDTSSERAKRLDKIDDFDPDKLIFFGSLETSQMLLQFQSLRKNSDYDAILVLTDEGSYELSSDKLEIPEITAPLWMVHLGGELPRAYEDTILQTIQNSKGGVAVDVATVIERITAKEVSGKSVVDDYSWSISKSNVDIDDEGLGAIAARQLVYNLTQNQQQLSLAELDAIHQVAKDYGIVTPYSSMIVLVNDRQREQLKAAEAKSDRFDREVETGNEQLETPFNPLSTNTVSGVPEPDVWILLGIVVMALFLISQRQKVQV